MNDESSCLATPGIGMTARAAMLGCLALAGCGGGGDDDAEAPAPPSRASAVALQDGGSIGTAHWPEGNSARGGQGAPVAGLECGLMATEYHLHTHLSIFLNGKMLQVPAQAGIVPATATRGECTYPLHTHDATGKLHVESAVPMRFTLGQFFAIWGQPLSTTNVGGLTGLPVVIYVADGSAVRRYTGDPGEIELTSHREITIQVGSPIDSIPNYTWAGD
jgi:hypothetical protein